jgi:starvation-inducible DNA-binding protein
MMAKKETKNKAGKGSSNAQSVMAKQLALVLSDTYVLAVKTHGYHWNVMGPNFGPLHALFEAQYNALILSADAIAERIRALGLMPDGSMDSFLQNTVIKEAGTKPLTANAMLKDLHASYVLLRERLVATEELADDIDDLVTQDIMTQQVSANDKTMWMLRAHTE